jgi:hypothetical protein
MAGTDQTVRVKLVPDIDEDALRQQILDVINGHVIVKPGETLVIRMKDWSADQVEYYQRYLNAQGLPFKVLAVSCDELAVAQSGEPAQAS